MGSVSPPGGGDPYASGLLHYWKMNEATGQTRVDLGSLGRDLGDVGTVPLDTDGPFGYNAHCQSSGVKLLRWTQADAEVGFDHSESFTLSLWFYVDRDILSSSDDLFRTLAAGPVTGLDSSWDSNAGGRFRNQVLQGGNHYTGNPAEDAWCHMTMRHTKGVSWTTQINGEAYPSGDQALGVIVGPAINITISGNPTAPLGSDFKVCEVAVWDWALTDADVAALYNGGSGRVIEVEV